jgi:hypothetical protein
MRHDCHLQIISRQPFSQRDYQRQPVHLSSQRSKKTFSI